MTRGYLQEIQDFMECVATGRQPLADLALAFETIKVNYAGYWPPKRAAASHCEILAPHTAWPLAEALDADHLRLGGVDRRFRERENRILRPDIARPNHRDMFAGILHHDRRSRRRSPFWPARQRRVPGGYEFAMA